MSEEFKFKIITLGESGVGKTWLSAAYTYKENPHVFLNTVGIDFHIKKIKLNDMDIEITIWDTSGQEKFNTLTTQYFNKADGILFVFDLTSIWSMERIRNWNEQLEIKNISKDKGKLLVGNKLDIKERQVSEKIAKDFAKEMNLDYIETSAKDKINVNEAFEKLIWNIIKAKKEGSEKKMFKEEREEFNQYSKLSKVKETPRDNCKCAYIK